MENRWSKGDVMVMLDISDAAVERAVKALFQRQTRQEQSAEVTIHRNGVGFSNADAGLGGYYAQWLEGGRKLDGRHLERARRMMKKYAGQLAEIANESGKPKAAAYAVGSN